MGNAEDIYRAMTTGNTEEIYKQHRGWSSARGKDFWISRAELIRADIEQQDRIITSEPRLERFIAIEYVLSGRPIMSHYTRSELYNRRRRMSHRSLPKPKTHYTLRALLPQGAVVNSIERLWRVPCGPTLLHGRIWKRLILAQAERDALQFHYARYLMAKDTKAEGL